MSSIFYKALKIDDFNTSEDNFDMFEDDHSEFKDDSPILQKRNWSSWLYGLLIVSGILMVILFGIWTLIAIGKSASLPGINSGTTSSPLPTTHTTKVIDLGYVKYTGIYDSVLRNTKYHGIPYAAPPVGQNRWREPREIENENDFNGEEIAANKTGLSCYELRVGSDRYKDQSEDCLTLDILVPEEPAPQGLPVVLFIHGGAYVFGNSQVPGEAIVNSSNGKMIFVSIQYRLGIFGFLAGKEIKKNGVKNAGLLDQRCALNWVSRNIQAFGGDPSKVTLWGVSAGGGSAAYQIMAYGGLNSVPFRAAILEYPWHPPLPNERLQDAVWNKALIASGCDSLSCLRELEPEALQDVNVELLTNPTDRSGAERYSLLSPVVDGDFIQDLPTKAFKSGRFHPVPILLDHSKNEGFIFTPLHDDQVEETKDAKAIFPSAGPSFFSRLYSLYPSDAFNNTFWQRQTWFGDFIINCPSYVFASSTIDHSPNSTAVFKMLFDASTYTHGATAPYLLSDDITYPFAKNRFIAEVLPSYWTSFILTMDPNLLKTESAPFWSSYSAGGRGSEETGESVGFAIMTVTDDDMYMKADDDASARCDFFMANADVVRV